MSQANCFPNLKNCKIHQKFVKKKEPESFTSIQIKSVLSEANTNTHFLNEFI